MPVSDLVLQLQMMTSAVVLVQYVKFNCFYIRNLWIWTQKCSTLWKITANAKIPCRRQNSPFL